MYIEEIVVDGFKSYQSRTQISGFDPNFNAITGLNGSGKSNILDAICFVLGITNYSQLRVNGLQELVYKHGQAGVRKASVSIVFNNEDKASSPIGYDQHDQIIVTRQIVIGGKSKFLINGIVAQTHKVQNLFHSVQLNIQNPHFLIMQGHIAKVLNMKPLEILSMLEEASGTRLFEANKSKALKTIAKKQLKVEEINKVLEEKIRPTLESLKLESQQYNHYLASKKNMEKLAKFLIAYDYYKTQSMLEKSTGDNESSITEIEDIKKDLKLKDERVENIKNQIQETIKKRDSEKSNDLIKLETLVGNLSKELTEISADFQNKQDLVSARVNRLESLKTEKKELSTEIESKKQEIEVSEKELEEKSKEKDVLASKFSALQQGYSSADDGGAKTVQDQLMDARHKITVLQTDQKTLEMNRSHLEEKLEGLKTEEVDKSSFDKLLKERNELEENVQDLHDQLKELQYSESDENQLYREIEKTEGELKKLASLAEPLARKFNYRVPKDIDPNLVFGMVCKLIDIENQQCEVALDIAGSSKLFNIVIEDANVGKRLIQKHKVQGLNRITCIPLDKIHPTLTDNSKVKIAKEIGSSLNKQVNHAIELLSYDEKFRKAIEYVFGNIFVCEDEETAQKVTFSNDIKTTSVTFTGNLYSPEGTLNGGSAPSSASIIKNVRKLKDLEKKMAALKSTISSTKDKIHKIRENSSIHQQLRNTLELKEHELSLLNQRIAQTMYSKHQEKIENINNQLKQILDDLNGNRASLEEVKSLAQKYEKLSSQGTTSGEFNIKEIKGLLDKAIKVHSDANKKHLKLKAELEEMIKERDHLAQQINDLEKALEKFKKELDQVTKLRDEKKEIYDRKFELYEETRELLSDCDGELAKYNRELEIVEKEKANKKLKLKQLELKVSDYKDDTKKLQKHLSHLKDEHAWVSKEKQFFGKEGSEYDFKSKDIQSISEELKALEKDNFILSKSINVKASNMLAKTDQECKELMEKQTQIKKDKEKIETVIKELEQKKIDTLNHTYEKVNQDFGSIFSELLPGANAKLIPDGKDVMDGLRVKVAFGDDWKESLSELSGGQKSLLALSLILSLLRFKPAPMYILDEIDAALDLSHTQNIGQVLKKKFSQSQFIVVSLKEGMFNNANVLFKTRFVDGVSNVDRIQNRR